MIKGTEDIVYGLLKEHKIFRVDDFLLYGAVIKKMGVDTTRPFKEIIINHKALSLPSFESVTRARRKLQEQYQDLVDYGMAVVRAEQKEKFIEYSRDWRK